MWYRQIIWFYSTNSNNRRRQEFFYFSYNNIFKFFYFFSTGSQAKCRETATQFSRDTGSEEVDIQPLNINEDDEVDENHIYTNKNFYDQDDAVYRPQTTGHPKISSKHCLSDL
jgi:hypothetical protein